MNEGFLTKETDFWALDGSHIKFWLPDPEPKPGAKRHPMKRSRFIQIMIDSDGRLNVNASRCLAIRSYASNVVTLDVEG